MIQLLFQSKMFPFSANGIKMDLHISVASAFIFREIPKIFFLLNRLLALDRILTVKINQLVFIINFRKKVFR